MEYMLKEEKIIGLRNIISHEYANIDYDIIWNVISKHLPLLKTTIERLRQDCEKD